MDKPWDYFTVEKKPYVIKCGGLFVAEKQWIMPLLSMVKEFVEKGNFVVIIHGGGPQADDLAHKLKVPIKKIDGKRVTDFPTLQIAKMTYAGLINTDLVSLCIGRGIQAIGISGVNSKLAEVVKRPKIKGIDFGYVGDIKKINKKLLLLLLENGYVPVVSCLGVDTSGQVFNINADSLAANIAVSLKASKLIFISDVVGVARDQKQGKFLRNLSRSKASELISKGVITGGMIPKVENAYLALGKGVECVQILGPLKTKKECEDAVLNDTSGTILKLSRPHSH